MSHQTETSEMDQELITAIKQLPLKDKMKAIALSHYRKLWLDKEDELNKKIDELKKQHFQSILPYQKEANDIISGQRAPKKDELGQVQLFLTAEEQSQQQAALTAEPLKAFWAKALVNADTIAEICSEEDLKVLEHLTKVENIYEPNSLNFTLRFHFSDNEYFNNNVVEKRFIFEKDERPIKSESTEIQWKQGRNITKKITKKRQRNKKTGQSREVEAEVDQPSFFQFFKTRINDEQDENDERAKLNMDFEIGQHLVEEVIPGALDYYLGIQEEADDMLGDQDEDDDDEDDEDEDDM